MESLIAAINEIRESLIAAERAHPRCPKLRKLHDALDRGFMTHGARLGLTEPEIAVLAGGGTPKTPQPRQ